MIVAPPTRFRWNKRDTTIVILLASLAALLRFIRLGIPPAFVFDETYYAKDACLYIGNSQQFCGLEQATEQSYVHPPLGKWLIAGGIRLFGYSSWGWRVAAAAAGTALVAAVYILTRKLFRDRWIAGIAGLLVATDFLLIVQSRIAMLDIFLALFVVMGFMFLSFDRERILAFRENWEGTVPRPPPAREMEWRFAAGASFGLALAVKWSAIMALVAAAGLALAWSIGIIRMKNKHPAALAESRWPNWGSEIGVGLVALLVLPAVVYLSSYSVYFADRLAESCPFVVPKAEKGRLVSGGSFGLDGGNCIKGPLGAAASFVDLHDRMLDYHLTLKADHDYQSRAWTWPLVRRPVAYYYPSGQSKSIHILAFGNVATWYAALAAGVWLLGRSFRKWRAESVVTLAWAAQYVPWLFVSRPLFFFYMTPIAPFMMIGLAAGLSALRDIGRLPRWAVIGFIVIGVGLMTIYFYPVLAAVGLPHELWRSRMWYPPSTCGDLKCGWI